MVTRVEPTAVQRGDDRRGHDRRRRGNFAGAWQLLCEGPGSRARSSTAGAETARPAGEGRDAAAAAGSVKATADRRGRRPARPARVRVATPQGVSSVGLVVVVDDPVVAEADDKANDQPAKGAQTLALPAVVAGAIGKAEDVDWYAFQATAGQRVTFSVWGNRLENKIHDLQTHFDPILAAPRRPGRELAADDNHDFADPLLSYEFKEAGTLLRSRSATRPTRATRTGPTSSQATAGPFATSVFPMAVNPGATAELRRRGANFDPAQTIRLDGARRRRPAPGSSPCRRPRGRRSPSRWS